MVSSLVPFSRTFITSELILSSFLKFVADTTSLSSSRWKRSLDTKASLPSKSILNQPSFFSIISYWLSSSISPMMLSPSLASLLTLTPAAALEFFTRHSIYFNCVEIMCFYFVFIIIFLELYLLFIIL